MYKEKVDFFDKQANNVWANNEYTDEELSKIERIFCLSDIKSGTKIIEPGCGTGRLTKLIAERCGKLGKVVAFDISLEMVKEAEKRLAGFENTELSCASLEDIKLKEEEFDIAFCHQVFPHFENQELALKILVKALKPGGFFLITHLIGIEEINDVHRKSNSPVINDIMPSNNKLRKMLDKVGLEVVLFEDKENVFNIIAKKAR